MICEKCVNYDHIATPILNTSSAVGCGKKILPRKVVKSTMVILFNFEYSEGHGTHLIPRVEPPLICPIPPLFGKKRKKKRHNQMSEAQSTCHYCSMTIGQMLPNKEEVKSQKYIEIS